MTGVFVVVVVSAVVAVWVGLVAPTMVTMPSVFAVTLVVAVPGVIIVSRVTVVTAVGRCVPRWLVHSRSVKASGTMGAVAPVPESSNSVRPTL